MPALVDSTSKSSLWLGAADRVLLLAKHGCVDCGTGIMEADDRHVTTVFTVQPTFQHRHSTNRVSLSVTSFVDDGNPS